MNGISDVSRYDGIGNRVRKNFSTGEKIRMVYSGAQLIAEYDLNNGALKKEYIYGVKRLIAIIEPSTGTRYTTADHLGSPRVVTNASAGIVSRHDFMPFGEEVGAGVGGRTISMGFSVSDGIRKKFAQKERDVETGLDYFNARYFSSNGGRFTSPDPLLASSDIMDPQTFHRYAYARNNPLRFIDPTGMKTETIDHGNWDKDGEKFRNEKELRHKLHPHILVKIRSNPEHRSRRHPQNSMLLSLTLRHQGFLTLRRNCRMRTLSKDMELRPKRRCWALLTGLLKARETWVTL